MYLQTCWSASPLRLCGLLLFVSPDDCLLLVILPESITQSTLSSLPSSNEPLLSIGGGGVGGGGGVAWSPHAQLIVAKLVPTMKVMWRLGFVWEEMRRARASLYTSEAVEGCGMRGIAITLLTEVGGRRSVGEASLLPWCRLPKRRFGTSTDAANMAHRA
jgi:hypothetical protein